MKKNFKLCYIRDNWAFFTTQELKYQRGDDWNDAPYECNAGDPYEWYPSYDEKPWEIKKLAFDGAFDAPCNRNEVVSVDQINGGATPWLRSSDFCKNNNIQIYAGISLLEFINKIREGEGSIYEKLEHKFRHSKPKKHL